MRVAINNHKYIYIYNPTLCTRNLCPGRGDAAGGTRKRENAKTRKRGKRQARKREKTKTRKRRKRQKRENAQSRKAVFAESKKTSQSIIALAIKDARRWEKHKKRETRKLENGKKCSRFLVVWSCTEAVHSVALWPGRLSQLWAYVF